MAWCISSWLGTCQHITVPGITAYERIAYRQLEPDGEECSDLEKLNVSWYYNWTPVPNCPAVPDVEFIPMIWSQKYLVDDNYEKYLVPLDRVGLFGLAWLQ